MRRIGIVVHPSRDISAPLGELRGWAAAHCVEVVQIPVDGQSRREAPLAAAADCDLVVSIGGDGTMLAAVRVAWPVDRPVLGVACGSLGVLTRVAPGEVATALDHFCAGAWVQRDLPALTVAHADGSERLALNDIAVMRAGIGQIRVVVRVEGELFARLAGDGLVVSTPLGSSAYSLAAGGPLLELDAEVYVVTPLPTHGGTTPPLVVGGRTSVELEIGQGYGGARMEIDGQAVPEPPERLVLGLRAAVARLVEFAGQEPPITVLRRRGIVSDSPRIRAADERTGRMSEL